MLQPKYLSKAVSKIMSDKRDADRVKSIFSGVISVDGEFRCHCIIRDVSNTGMKLEVEKQDKVPEKFYIKTPALPGALPVESVWRRHLFLGVRFITEEQYHSEDLEEPAPDPRQEFVA